MDDQLKTERIPILLVIYPAFSVIVFGWTVLASVGLPILVGLDVMKSEAQLRWDWQLSAITGVFFVNFLYSLVFLLSSIGVLCKKQKWLHPFRRCAIVLDAYLVLCAGFTIVAIPFTQIENRELGIAVMVLMVSLATALTMITKRLLRHLANPDVVGIFR